MYAVIEGAEATGKSTQVSLVADRLRKEGHKVYLTKEPGGPDKLSQTIRQIILNPETKASPEASLCLFLADRCQNMLDVKSKLDEGYVVLSDRSSFSSFVYYAAAVPEANALDIIPKIAPLLDFAQQIQPDWCFVCNADYEWSKDQLKARSQLDRIEQFGEDFHKRVHKYFEQFYLNRLQSVMEHAPVRTLRCASASTASKEVICDQICSAMALQAPKTEAKIGLQYL